MANKIILKRSSVEGKSPSASDLEYGELALNYADGKIYFKGSDNTIQTFNAGAGGTGSGTVSSVEVQSTDLSVTGSPITTNGTISLSLNTVSVAKGGTGATDAANARANLTAAKSGANGDITSLSGLTTALSIAQGGTGVTSFSSGYLKSDGTSLTTSNTISGADVTGNISGNASNVTGTVAVDNGGTGASTADNARLNLSAAKSGANSDITSLSGLTTALSIAQGGTGSTSAQAALNNLVGTQTANRVLRSNGTNVTLAQVGLTTDVSGTLPVANGGTGAIDAENARANLTAAKSGANSDITSLTGLTTALSIAQGGTGVTSFSSGYLKSNGTSLTSSSTVNGADVTGAVSEATAVANTGSVTTDADFYVSFVQNNTSTAQGTNTSSNLKYNPGNGTVTAPSLSVNQGNFSSATLITTNTSANQIVDSVDGSVHRTAKYVVQVTSGNVYQTSEILIVHDDSIAYYTEFATISTGPSLATFNANYTNGRMQLRVTPTNSVTTIRAIRTCINV